MAINMNIVCIVIFFSTISQFAIADSVDGRLKRLEEVVTKQLVSIDNLQKQVRNLENENMRLKVNQASMESKIDLHEKELESNRAEHLDPGMEVDFKDRDGNVSTNRDIKMMGTSKVRSISPYANVAFHSSMSNTKCFHTHEPYVFDVEEIDEGNGYNSHDGIYVVPVTGVYVFTFTIASGEHFYIRPEIVVNGSVKGASISDSDDSSDIHPATVIIVVSVTAGDHVFVRTEKANTCYIMSDVIHGKSSFSGWLLF